MATPLPSPNGTNYERLYITRGPMAHDAAPDDTDDTRAMFKLFLAKLSEDEKAILRSMLDGADTPVGGAAGDRRRAGDAHMLQVPPEERERIRMMVDAFGERVSGSSSTAAQAAYDARFPNANRPKY